jgi:hypothetical protein
VLGSGYEVTGTEDVVLVVGRRVLGSRITGISVDLLCAHRTWQKE